MRQVDGEWVEVSYQQLRHGGEFVAGLVDLGISSGTRFRSCRTRPEWTCACSTTFRPARLSVRLPEQAQPGEYHYVLVATGRRRCSSRTPSGWRRSARRADLPGAEDCGGDGPADADGARPARCAARAGARAERGPSSSSASPVSRRTTRACSSTRRDTGPPKACAELTHGNYRAITSAVETRDLVREDDCVYLFLPLAHALALVVHSWCSTSAPRSPTGRGPAEDRGQPDGAGRRSSRPCRGSSRRSIRWPRPPRPSRTRAATRVGMAVRQAQHRGEEFPAELQATSERADEALFANVCDLFGGRLRRRMTGAAPITTASWGFFYACSMPVDEATESSGRPPRRGVGHRRIRSVPFGRPLPGVHPDHRRRRSPDQRPEHLQGGLLPRARPRHRERWSTVGWPRPGRQRAPVRRRPQKDIIITADSERPPTNLARAAAPALDLASGR